MTKMLINITWKEGEPTVDQIIEKYGIEPDEIDDDFGVIEIDPDENLYTLLIEQTAAERVRNNLGEDETDFEGPFSNARIEPFGLMEEPGTGIDDPEEDLDT